MTIEAEHIIGVFVLTIIWLGIRVAFDFWTSARIEWDFDD